MLQSMQKRDRATSPVQSHGLTRNHCPQDEEHDPQFEPVIKLTEQVETKTFEEDEDALFKMYFFVLMPSCGDV